MERPPMIIGPRSREAISVRYRKSGLSVPLSNVSMSCAVLVGLTIEPPDGEWAPFSNTECSPELRVPLIELTPTEDFVKTYPDLGYRNPITLRAFLTKLTKGKNPVLVKGGSPKHPAYQVETELYEILRAEMVEIMSIPWYSHEFISAELKDAPEIQRNVLNWYSRVYQAGFIEDVRKLVDQLSPRQREVEAKGEANDGGVADIKRALDDYIVVQEIINRLVEDEPFISVLKNTMMGRKYKEIETIFNGSGT